jgi:sugar lactone lactonase YvrE
MKMKKTILSVSLLFITYFAFGQCGPYHIATAGTSCTSDTLVIPGASGAAKITWLKNGVAFDSSNGHPVGPVTTVAGGNVMGNAANQLDVPSCVFIDRSGYLYVSDFVNARVQKFPPGSTSGTIATTVAGGNGTGTAAFQLNTPSGIFVDSSGNLYVSDGGNGRIQKFPAGSTSATNGITVAGGNGVGTAGNQLVANGIYVDRSGYIYVADFYNERIIRFPPGSTSDTLGITVAGGNGQGAAANQLNDPYSVYVDASGNIYVADRNNNRVQKFPAGSTSATNGITIAGGNGPGASGSGSAANQLYTPVGVYGDTAGNIYVSDETNRRVQKFPPGSTSATNATTVAGGNGIGSAADQFDFIGGIYVDGYGSIYVADGGDSYVLADSNNRVQKWGQPTILGGIDTSLIVTSAGSYTAIVTDVSGCAGSSDTIFIRVNPASSIIKNICRGDTYTFNGMSISASGIYRDTLIAGNGCDSIITLTLTVDTVTNISQSVSICQGSTYSFGGRNLSASGIYYDTLSSSLGCDSIITTLHLTVRPTAGSSFSQGICQGYSYTFGGRTLLVSGIYSDTLTSSTGCDSIITLTLTVYNLYGNNISQTICQGSTYTFGNRILSVPGTYYDTLTASSGCDSVVTLTINVHTTANDTISQAICPGSGYPVGTHTYTNTGIYTDTLRGASVYGCDSIVTLELLVLDTTTAYFYLQPSDSSPHLWFIIDQSFGIGLTYLWSWGDSTTCTGDTPSHTYATAGYYNICVTATNGSGCSATYCDTSIYLYKDQAGQMVYVRVLTQAPNGINTISTDRLNINYYADAVHFSEALKAPTDLTLYDLSGRVVMRQSDFSGSVWPISSDIAQGVYIIRAQSGGYTVSKKLVVTR